MTADLLGSFFTGICLSAAGIARQWEISRASCQDNPLNYTSKAEKGGRKQSVRVGWPTAPGERRRLATWAYVSGAVSASSESEALRQVVSWVPFL